MATKYAQIPEIKSGVVFSDPWYDGNVWCQYRKDFSDANWLMKLDTKTDDGVVLFEMSLGRPTMSASVKTQDEGDNSTSVSFPHKYDLKEVELGMDTACIFCGTKENFEHFGEAAALRTGRDGMFGDLMVFTCKGEDAPAGFVLLGAIDEMFADEEHLFKHLSAGFDGLEISAERYASLVSPDSIEHKMCAAAEAQSVRAAASSSPKGKEDQEPER